MIVIRGIPYPGEGEMAEWGRHAIVVVGYDDARKINNLKSNKEMTGVLPGLNNDEPRLEIKKR